MGGGSILQTEIKRFHLLNVLGLQSTEGESGGDGNGGDGREDGTASGVTLHTTKERDPPKLPFSQKCA